MGNTPSSSRSQHAYDCTCINCRVIGKVCTVGRLVMRVPQRLGGGGGQGLGWVHNMTFTTCDKSGPLRFTHALYEPALTLPGTDLH